MIDVYCLYILKEKHRYWLFCVTRKTWCYKRDSL